ncbi:MAG TPA: HIT family protein [Methylomirabilota bacterium]|nr:HIT family protein [Methylomirabilota bacterium]
MSPAPRREPGGCLFCRIARGEEPAAVVLEAPAVLAFLDHRPLFPGHTLVVPREHVDTLADLPARLTAPLFDAVSHLARGIEAAMTADGSFVAVNNRVSQSVPHLHVHVVPRRRGDGLRGFFWPRGHYASAEEMEETRRRIAAAVARSS